jgi:transcriptional regulator with GAF, ATPase, and Fis domain
MDSIIGHNAGLRSVLERATLVAKSDVPVLILGETGSGKEVLARHVHEQSRRAKLPFLKVNCGAVPTELIDSYLFGHERGAFTGAMEKRKGWFESANGGTLLLDEIGELPLAAQVRFLRVLQDGSFEPVGSSGKTIKVDVRVIAATHRNLRRMVNEGNFREDLWYRISVFPIRIPPLRERKEDLIELAIHFAKRAAVKFDLPETGISREDINILEMYDWPGNVREFGAVIDRAVLLGEGQRFALAESLRELKLENGLENEIENGIDFIPAANNIAKTNFSISDIDRFNKIINEYHNISGNSNIYSIVGSKEEITIDKDKSADKSTDNATLKISDLDSNSNSDSDSDSDNVELKNDILQESKLLKAGRSKSKWQQSKREETKLLDSKKSFESQIQEQLDIQREAEIANFLSLNDAVRRHIESALTLTNGTIEGDHGTAALLKINPHTLRAKMRRLGIDWSKYRK